MAPERGRVALALGRVDRVPADGGGKVGVGEDCGLGPVEPGNGLVLLITFIP
jgi:hypothetical protein